MTFVKVKNYNGRTGEVYNEIFEVQKSDGKKYLVNWNQLINYDSTAFRIIKEDLEKKSALAAGITNSDLISRLKENYESRLDPKAFKENAPLIDFEEYNKLLKQ